MFNNAKSSSKPRRLRVESLENRRFMAGDVTAQFYNGTLDVTESNLVQGAASDISITSPSKGIIRVSANPATGGKVNGQAFIDFANTNSPNLRVNLKDGADKLKIENLSFKNVDILMGKTNSIMGDNDEVTINGMTTRGALKITTEDGNDTVRVFRSTIGNGFSDSGEVGSDGLYVQTGKGSDSVTIGDGYYLSHINGVLDVVTTSRLGFTLDGRPDQTELGNDVVFITNVDVDREIRAVLGGGTDTFNALGVTAGDYVYVDGGDGNDTARLRDVYAKSFFAKMGAGNDTLDLNSVRALSHMDLKGGLGTDTLIRNYSGAPTQYLGEWEVY